MDPLGTYSSGYNAAGYGVLQDTGSLLATGTPASMNSVQDVALVQWPAVHEQTFLYNESIQSGSSVSLANLRQQSTSLAQPSALNATPVRQQQQVTFLSSSLAAHAQELQALQQMQASSNLADTYFVTTTNNGGMDAWGQGTLVSIGGGVEQLVGPGTVLVSIDNSQAAALAGTNQSIILQSMNQPMQTRSDNIALVANPSWQLHNAVQLQRLADARNAARGHINPPRQIGAVPPAGTRERSFMNMQPKVMLNTGVPAQAPRWAGSDWNPRAKAQGSSSGTGVFLPQLDKARSPASGPMSGTTTAPNSADSAMSTTDNYQPVGYDD